MLLFTLKINIGLNILTLHELKGQDEPRPLDPGDVEEAQTVAEQTRGQNLHTKRSTKLIFVN
jgi:hypothetical protein